MARTITLKNPERFKDPANLTWERYVALQARERERYLAERASIPADALAYRTVSPRYLERAVDQFANNYYSELSATHYIATAAANAPFDELKKCCLFQVADEQRHLEMDREVFERAGIPERDWLPAWEAPGTTCRFFRHLLELEDTIEILVKATSSPRARRDLAPSPSSPTAPRRVATCSRPSTTARACATRRATSASRACWSRRSSRTTRPIST